MTAKVIAFPGVALPEPERPAPALNRETAAAFFEALNRIVTGHCPHCGAVVERSVQVGRGVVGEPCGHRLYQGKAGAFPQRRADGGTA